MLIYQSTIPILSQLATLSQLISTTFADLFRLHSLNLCKDSCKLTSYFLAHTEGHPVDFSPSRIKAIQAIQDDPAIDAEIAPHDGIGIAMGHGVHHSPHGYHHGEGHSYGGNDET